MTKPVTIDQLEPLKIEEQPTIEWARATALQCAVQYAQGKHFSKQDVFTTAEEFLQYIVDGTTPPSRGSW